MSELHDNMEDNPRLWQAGVIAGAALLHYSLPDVVPCRTGRALLKTAINVGAVATAIHADPGLKNGLAEIQDNYEGADDNSQVAIVTSLGLVVALSVGLAIGAEKWIYRRAEKKRQSGTKAAHTKQALVLGALAGLATYAVYDK